MLCGYFLVILELGFSWVSLDYFLNQVSSEYSFDFVLSFFWVFLSGLEDLINESFKDHLMKPLQGLLYTIL